MMYSLRCDEIIPSADLVSACMRKNITEQIVFVHNMSQKGKKKVLNIYPCNFINTVKEDGH